MTRVRTDNVFGTLTDNPLTAGATTMNSAGLANLAAVSSAEAFIILDPNRVAGAPEIVVVTAHTGSATSATIARGQFGTTARQHAQGTEWVHGPIASNASSFVTAADDQGDFVPMNAWEAWVPTLGNLTLGNGISQGAFVRMGRTIMFRWRFVLGSTSAVGSDPTFTLPVAAVNPPYGATADQTAIGEIHQQDLGGSSRRGLVWISGTNPASGRIISYSTTGGAVVTTSTVPFTWATGDSMFAWGFYEAAS